MNFEGFFLRDLLIFTLEMLKKTPFPWWGFELETFNFEGVMVLLTTQILILNNNTGLTNKDALTLSKPLY